MSYFLSYLQKKIRFNFTVPLPFPQNSHYGLPTVFFLPPVPLLFLTKKPIRLPYHNFSASSDVLTVYFCACIFTVYRITFYAYGFLIRFFITVNLGPNCPPGVLSWDLGLSKFFGCCFVNYCGGGGAEKG